jgi:hypothetical protein
MIFKFLLASLIYHFEFLKNKMPRNHGKILTAFFQHLQLVNSFRFVITAELPNNNQRFLMTGILSITKESMHNLIPANHKV